MPGSALMVERHGAWHLTVERREGRLRARAVQIVAGRIVRKLGGTREEDGTKPETLMAELRDAIGA